MIYQEGILLSGVGIVRFLKGMGRISIVGTASCFPVGIIGLNFLTFCYNLPDIPKWRIRKISD